MFRQEIFPEEPFPRRARRCKARPSEVELTSDFDPLGSDQQRMSERDVAEAEPVVPQENRFVVDHNLVHDVGEAQFDSAHRSVRDHERAGPDPLGVQ
jgi:hypothetical protein